MSRSRHTTGPVSRALRGLRNADAPLDPAPAESGHSVLVMPERLARDVYTEIVRDLSEYYKITVRKWRSHMIGSAWELTYRDGSIKRFISVPRPRGPVSASIFLHEVGHHAIGFRRYTPRCLEEHYVWQWAFREMEARGIPITKRVMKHFQRSMFHYVKRALRRHEHVPPELMHFSHWPG